jgi:excisionase family DNA binding protein
MPEPDEFMTVAEVAAILKLNQQTVRNWIDAGTLPAVRIGRRVRIKRSDFDRVVESSYSGPAEPTSAAASIWDGEVAPPEAP